MKRNVKNVAISVCSVSALALVASCASEGASSGDESGGSDFEQVKESLTSWDDLCEVLDPDDVTGQMGIAGYEYDNPTHVDLGGALNADAISCTAEYSIEQDGPDRVSYGEVLLSVFPADSSEHLDEMYEMRLSGWADSNIDSEADSEILLDDELEGPWNEAQVRAVGQSDSDSASLISSMKADTHLVEVFLVVPPDIGVNLAQSYDLSDEEINERRHFDFDFEELATWVADDYTEKAFDSVSASLQDE